jgi:formate dehydrogenase alpha subunit
LISGEGRIQRLRRAVDPPGTALPDWDIFCRLARKMGRKGFAFRGIRQLQREMSRCLSGHGDFSRPDRRSRPLEQPIDLKTGRCASVAARGNRLTFILSASIEEHTYREVRLADHIKDAAVIFARDRVSINPADAKKSRIHEGDRVIVSRGRWQSEWTAHITERQPMGTLQVTFSAGNIPRPNPGTVRIKRRDV